MKISLRTYSTIAELTIESDSTKIVEDVTNYRAEIPEDFIEQLITVARDMCNFNRVGDIEFVRMIHDNFLSDSEQGLFKDIINTY